MILFQIISFEIVAFTAGLFTFFILISSKIDKLSRSFIIASLCIAAWTIFSVLGHMAENKDTALLFFQASVIFSLLIPASFFNFTTYFVELATHIDYRKYRKAVYIIGIFFSLILIFDILGLTGLIVPGVDHKWWFPYWPNAGPMYKYALVYFFGTFIAGFYILFKFIRTTQDNILKRQAKFVFGGVIIAMLGGSTNYLLLYNVGIPPFGTILIAAYIIPMFYAVARYKIFNIKVIITQLVVFTIWAFLFFRIFFSSTITEFVVNVLFLLLVIFFGMFLIKSVLNEIEQKEQLQIITGELKNLTDHLQEKVDEQTKNIKYSYGVEKKARIELEELSSAKDEFILSAQSNLISPLESVERHIKKLKGLSLPKGAVDDVLKIADSTERLKYLVDEFASISQIRVSKAVLKMERINLSSTVRGILDELASQIREKNLKYSLTFPPKEEENVISLDKERMKEALTNLIDNAVKYNREGGEIKVKGERVHHPIERDKIIYRLTIEDTGIGIPKEELPKLFTQYFQRGKEAEKVYTTGKGIGLTVTKSIVEAHGGRVYAESGDKGKGSKFTVELLV